MSASCFNPATWDSGSSQKCSIYIPHSAAAAKSTLIKQGQCPKGFEIKSLSACSAAAKYLKLQDTSAAASELANGNYADYYRDYKLRSNPPFCYYEGGSLKFNGGSNTGSCSNYDQCLCHISGLSAGGFSDRSMCVYLICQTNKKCRCVSNLMLTSFELRDIRVATPTNRQCIPYFALKCVLFCGNRLSEYSMYRAHQMSGGEVHEDSW